MRKFKIKTPELLREFGERCMQNDADRKYMISAATTWKNAMKRDGEFDLKVYIEMSRQAAVSFGRTVRNSRKAHLVRTREFIAQYGLSAE